MQFSHPKPEKLLKLLNDADEPWNFDEELKCDSQKRVRSTNYVRFIRNLHLQSCSQYFEPF